MQLVGRIHNAFAIHEHPFATFPTAYRSPLSMRIATRLDLVIVSGCLDASRKLWLIY